MNELRHDGHSDVASVLASFRDQRRRLGQILAATVTFGRRTGGETFTVVLRDDRGDWMLLSGCGAAGASDPPRGVVQILLEAGFAADAAAAALTHGLVRLSRTPDGTTVLERAMRLRRPVVRAETAAKRACTPEGDRPSACTATSPDLGRRAMHRDSTPGSNGGSATPRRQAQGVLADLHGGN